MSLSARSFAITLTTLSCGLALSLGCEPRKTAKTGGTAAATGTTGTAAPTTTATPTATATATAAPTPTPTPTTTAAPAPTPTGTAAPTATAMPVPAWPTALPPIPGLDPATIAKTAQDMGIPLPGGAVPAPAAGDPLDAALKASAAKNAPGFTPIGSVGKATLKQGEHAGMNVNLQQGKCYVFIAVGGPGVSQIALSMLTTPPLPSTALATDTGPSPALGAPGKQQLCPPAAATIRADVVIAQGAGQVAVQALAK